MFNIVYTILYATRKHFYLFFERLGEKKFFVSYTAPARLQRLFALANLSILDIGARRGPLSEFQFFAPFARLILCEPDEKEALRLKETLKGKGQWRDVTVITDAIDPTAERVTLNITREEGLSSLLEPNKKILSQFYPSDSQVGHKKYSLDNWEVTRRIEVPAITLDAAAQKYGFSDISVLKVDTQGTELGILESGSATVLPSVVAVYVEAEFMALYTGQALFGNVHDFLQRKGFRLVDIKRTYLRRVFPNQPIYSKRELAWAHGLYFREINADKTPLTALQKIKVSCVAANFEFFDYAIWLLRDLDVVALLRRSELVDGVEQDMSAYSAALWTSIKKTCSWREWQRIMRDSWNDRNIER